MKREKKKRGEKIMNKIINDLRTGEFKRYLISQFVISIVMAVVTSIISRFMFGDVNYMSMQPTEMLEMFGKISLVNAIFTIVMIIVNYFVLKGYVFQKSFEFKFMEILKLIGMNLLSGVIMFTYCLVVGFIIGFIAGILESILVTLLGCFIALVLTLPVCFVIHFECMKKVFVPYSSY